MPHTSHQKNSAREVCFWLYRQKNQVLEGRIVVTPAPGVSTFGAYREFNLPGVDHSIGLFEGAIFEHSLQADGSAKIQLDYYIVEADAASSIGYAQVRDIGSGLFVGAESGVGQVESVALGQEYELAFRSQTVA